MVSLVGRWRAHGVRGGATGMPRSAGDAAARRQQPGAGVRAALRPAEAAVLERRDQGGRTTDRGRHDTRRHPARGRAARLQGASGEAAAARARPGADPFPADRPPPRRGLAGPRPGARPSGAGRSGQRARGGHQPRERGRSGLARRPAEALGRDESAPGGRSPAQAPAMARSDHAPPAPGAVGARPRLGRDQPHGAGDAVVPDDRLQQGDQPRRAADPRRAGARHDHAVRVRVGPAQPAQLHRQPHRRPSRCGARQRGRASPDAPAAARLREGADRADPRAHAPARQCAPVLHEPDAAAAGRSRLRRRVRRRAVLPRHAPRAHRAGGDAAVLAALDARPAPPAAAGRGGLPGGRRQGVQPRRGGEPGAHRQGARPRARDGAALQGEARRRAPGPATAPAISAAW